LVTARIRRVNESGTDPLIRFADLSPARRGTAWGFGSVSSVLSRLPLERNSAEAGEGAARLTR
jgi:hypothetical protein